MGSTTKAWTWQGDPDPLSLKLAQVTLAGPRAHEVVVENKAIALNPVDWKVLSGELPGWKPGHTPGVDAAGVVVAAGEHASIAVGTRVVYHCDLQRPGSFAAHTVVDERALIRIPSEVGFAVAATVPCPGITSWQALDKIPTVAGRDLLIIGGGAATGTFLVQLALQRGFRVWTTAGPAHRERLLAIGVSGVLDYHDAGWREKLLGHLDRGRLYAAIDIVNEKHARTLAPLIGYNGHLVCIQDRLNSPPLPAFTTVISQHEVALGAIYRHGAPWDWREYQNAGISMLRDISSGRMSAPAIAPFSFQQLPQALASLKAGDNGGKRISELS